MKTADLPFPLADGLDAYTIADVAGQRAIVTLPTPLVAAAESPWDGSLVFTGAYILDLVRAGLAGGVLDAVALSELLNSPPAPIEPPRIVTREEFDAMSKTCVLVSGDKPPCEEAPVASGHSPGPRTLQ